MSPMIPDPEAYFRQFIPPRDALLLDLESEAAKEEIPIVGPVVGELLFLLARITHAKRILELGTATGYSYEDADDTVVTDSPPTHQRLV